jgi:hypothetical protein
MRQVASSLALRFGLLNLLRHVAPSAFYRFAAWQSRRVNRLILSPPISPDLRCLRIVRGHMPSRIRCKVFLSGRLRFEFAGLPLLRSLALSVACAVPDHFAVRFHENVSQLRVAQHFRCCCVSVATIDHCRYRWQSMFINRHGQRIIVLKIDAYRCVLTPQTQRSRQD